uniref:chondroitinase family polysaccharide lyase n=1 Tax=Pedobacter glucosidilyticus TaxID=1122941 RepID=UPI00047A73FC
MKRILLFFILLYGVTYLKAQTVTFDGITSVPSNWTTTSSSGNLALSTTRFKSGTQALKWTPTNNQTLTVSGLTISLAQTQNSNINNTHFYIFTNTNSASDTLLVQFLNPSGEVKRTGTIVLNFTGWREYHRNLVADYGGGNALPGFDLSTVKFTFKKKSGTTGSRQIWIDEIDWVGDKELRYPGTHMLVDNSQFLVTSSLRGGQPLSSWLNTPDIALVTPNSAELIGIDSLKKRYSIVPTSSTAPVPTPAELAEARAYYKYCGPSLTSGTLYYIRGLLSDINQDSLVKFSRYCNIFARKYFNNTTQSNLDTLTLFTRYLIDQGVAEGGRNVMETNAYDNARVFNDNFIIVAPLISDANVKSDLIKMLKWSNEYNKIYSNQFLVRNNMDFVHLKLENIIKLALLSNDNAEIVRDLKSINRFMAQVMEPGDGGRDGVKPDGLGYHHQSKYFHYMYAYATWIDHAYNLRGTPFKISLEAYNYMLTAVKVLFLELNKGAVRANSSSGRFPFNQSSAVRISDFRKLVTVGGNLINQTVDPDAAALYNYFYKTTYYPGVPTVNLDGFHQFNYGPMGIKRHKNWVAIAKGLTNKMFGTEIYANANRYGRYQGYGALDILYETTAATGYISGGDGWDWNVMPGTTTVHLSDYADLRPPTNSTRDEYQAKSFVGALSAGNDGIFAMDFVQDAGGRYETNNLTFRKSVFAFDSILV